MFDLGKRNDWHTRQWSGPEAWFAVYKIQLIIFNCGRLMNSPQPLKQKPWSIAKPLTSIVENEDSIKFYLSQKYCLCPHYLSVISYFHTVLPPFSMPLWKVIKEKVIFGGLAQLALHRCHSLIIDYSGQLLASEVLLEYLWPTCMIANPILSPHTYLIIVHFGTPPHYLAWKKFTEKCVNSQQNSLNWSKWAKISRSLC